MANVPDIQILAGLQGGGSLSGETGKLIQQQLNSIAAELNGNGGLKIKVDVQTGQNKQRITALQQAKIATEEATRAEKLRALQVKTSAAEDSRLAAELKRAAAAQKVAASETDKQTKADAQANIVREKALATLKLMEAQFPKMKGTAYEAQFNAIKEGLDDQTMSGEEANAQLVMLRKNVAAAGLAGQTFGQKMSAVFAKFAQYVSVSTIILSTIRTIKQMVSNVTELDSAMVDLQIASGKSYDEVEKLIGSYHKLGQEMGATTTEVAKSADAWLRQGYNVSEASKLIKASMILAKLGQIESAEASKYLTSAMKGYKLSVDDAISVVDKLAATDMEAAVSAGGIATAMAETAVSADVAGISMDRLIGYIAKVAEVTQDGEESVGTFFKTLTARMGNVKANRLVDPETGDDISDVETVLRSYSIALRDTDSEFRNFGDVLDEVAANWDNYGSVAQHAIAVAFSGTRQQEKFLVLMENYQDAMRLAGVSADSAGTALEKYKVVQDGISARADALKSQWQELSSAIVDDNAIKSVISGGTSILNILTQIIQKLGLIPTLTIGLSAALGYKGNGKVYALYSKVA